jgi:hypothetical protein
VNARSSDPLSAAETAGAAVAPRPAPIPPTVGRVILVYWPARWVGERAALIAGVNADGTIEVDVSRRQGDATVKPDELARVSIVSSIEAPAEGPWAEWMQFQTGQAQKTEQSASAMASLVDGLRRQVDRLIDGLEVLSGRVRELERGNSRNPADETPVTTPPAADATPPSQNNRAGRPKGDPRLN